VAGLKQVRRKRTPHHVGAARFGVCVACLWLVVGTQAVLGKPFTVAEEIETAQFGDPGEARAIQFSPDGHYFAVLTERGRLDLNRPEDTLRIYRSQDVRTFLGRPDASQPPPPCWTLNRATDQDGPLITHWHWLADSSGIAFLERGAHGSNRLMLADLKQKTLEPLTPNGATIKAFDIRDRRHYVYAVADPGLLEQAATESKAAAIVGTDRPLLELLFPVDQNPYMTSWVDRSELWAVVGDKPFRVEDRNSGRSLVLFSEGQRNLALSPDGQSLVTALAVAEIPSAWEKLYPLPFAASPLRMRAGKQDLATFAGDGLVSRYVRIDLRHGAVQSLGDGPTGLAVGWDAGATPAWSQDGKAIVLPDAFVASDTAASARACVAVVTLSTGIPSCLEPIKGPSATGSYENSRWVEAVRFEGRNGRKVRVSYYSNGDDAHGSTEYQETATGTWTVINEVTDADPIASGDLEVRVKQALNDPPVLVTTDLKTKGSRILWDPNPQLKDVVLGEAIVYRWKDKTGRDWKGGLFKPVPYEAGHRYPLVIQTHGFSETEFRPSGSFPTAFAARALAGAGLVVLQVSDCPIYSTPEEGPCNVNGYEAAVNELAKTGLVDSERVGLVGFSRTCFDVMQALTTSSLHIKAASITDGVMAGYFQYLTYVDLSGNSVANEYDALVGARPFGAGLQQWLKHSPLFNVDKVSAALQVASLGRVGLLTMWEPYAVMRYLHKPVDLILLNNDEHVLSNPAARLASQGGTLDWMRFWLQGYEDPDQVKAEQYKRWEQLCDMQVEQNPNQPAFCVRSKTH
jgi:dipeptidyl aminopeptidase/acylaminoacyl peptidase